MKDLKYIFNDRFDAFDKLCLSLPMKDMKQEEWIILATSSNGVPIALSLAKELNAKFDFLFTHKIYAPKNDECEVAIITETGEIVVHEELMRSFKLNIKEIYNSADRVIENHINSYKAKYRDNCDIINLKGANVLLVDEGLNTGLTMMACIKSVINQNARSICVAVPILPEVTVKDIETIADDLYYVTAPPHFVGIDFYYRELIRLKLEDVKELQKKIKLQ